MSKHLSFMRLKNTIQWGAITLAALVFGLNPKADATEKIAAEQVATTRIFSRPLSWVGEGQPNPAQSADLVVSISVFKNQGVNDGIASLEGFLRASPNSGWAPSLRAFLGKHYRDRGRYTLALEHWEKAWAATKDARDTNGRNVADFTLAHWTKLLASLGRRELLAEIFETTKNRAFADPQLRQEYLSAREGYQHMNLDPGTSYRCGTYALHQVGRMIKGTNFNGKVIGGALSPHAGFTMSKLVELAGQSEMPVVAVQRQGNAEIIVPSVVHWKQDHYAAIVAQRGELYKVADPTFEKTIWMKKETILAETSGYFLVPQNQIPAEANRWNRLTVEQAQSVRGRGYASVHDDDSDDGDPDNDPDNNPDDNPDPDGPPPTNPPPDNPPPDNPPPCPCDEECSGEGMAVWWVSEPNINLWIKDIPVFYQSGLNGKMSFKVEYKQRQAQPYDTNLFNFGRIWHGNVRSYLKVIDSMEDPDYANYDATLYGPDGAERRFLYDDTGVDLYSRTRLERMTNGGGNLIGFKLFHRNGRVVQFTHLRTNLVGELEAFMTVNTERTGKRPVTFNYQTTNDVVQLLSVVDASGGTNVIRYHTNNIWLIKEIENPHGGKATFAYNGSGYLTNITDMIGMASSFLYDGNGWVTNLTTPYGTTSFAYSNNIIQPPVSHIWRAVQVTVPNGAKHLYMYRSTRILTPDLTQELLRYNPEEYHYNAFNTAYWGPRQYALLSTNDYAQFSANDFDIARNKLWQGNEIPVENENPYNGITLLMLAQRWPSPNLGEEGHKVFYTYDSGQASPRKKSYLLPGGTTNIVENFRNSLGYVTNRVSTWSTGGSSTVLWRTNQYIYSTNGVDLVKFIGPAGHVEAEYAYNTNHQILFMTNAVGYVTSYTYNTNGQVTSILTPAGLTTTNLYYSDGTLQKTIDLEIGRTNQFFWTNGLLYARINECGLATTNTYDLLNRLSSVRFPDGTTTSNVYTYLDLIGSKDRLGNWTYQGFDNMRRRTAFTNALGHVTQYGYCICGSLDSMTNALGQVTSFTYDRAGRQTAVIDAALNPTTYIYDKLGRVFYITDAMNRSATNHYNNQGRLFAVSNALGRIKAIAYNIEDLATNTVDANGVTISMTYDNAHRLLSRTYPDTGVERFGYSAKGMIAYTNQLTNVTRYSYDVVGRKTSETNANSEVVSYTYNASGERLTLTDGKNQITTWNYDEYCRVTNKVDALTNVLFVYRYDADGRLTNRWSAAKGNTYFAYDVMGSLTNVDYPVSTDIQMQYDALQRLTNMVDAVGTTKYAYTSTGQIQSENGPWTNDTVTYTYTANRMRESMSLLGANGRTWMQNYFYDSGNRLDETTSNAGTFDYTYQTGASILVQELRLPGGSMILNTHDGNSRLTNTKLQNSSATVLNQHAYIYNVGNQRTKQTFTDGNYTDYTYDGIGQLRTAIGYEYGGSTARLQEQMGYAYDAAGNLNWRTNNALIQDFNVNALNQLATVGRSGTYTVAGKVANGEPPISVSINGQSASVYADLTFAKAGFSLSDGTNSFATIASDISSQSATNIIEAYLPVTAIYQYDHNGNLLSDGYRTFAYDDENQLIRVSVTNSWKSEFMYDGKQRRRVRNEFLWSGSDWVKTNEVRYVYDRSLVIQERNSDNQTTVSYTRGADMSGDIDIAGGIGGLLARTQASTMEGEAAVQAYYHCDANGNVTALVNMQMVVVAAYVYGPHGNLISKKGILSDANLYRFSSKEYHSPSMLYHYLYRYYDSSTQRWLTSDPAGEAGGLNLYTFSKNSPVMEIDPFGLCPPGWALDPTKKPFTFNQPLANSVGSVAFYGSYSKIIPGCPCREAIYSIQYKCKQLFSNVQPVTWEPCIDPVTNQSKWHPNPGNIISTPIGRPYDCEAISGGKVWEGECGSYSVIA